MSIPSSHPLLSLVDANKNTLKCALVKYIDVTVENQFGILRDRIVHMIESGEILHVNSSDQQFTLNTIPSLVSPIITSAVIKQECHDSSAATIPINVHCNDTPNGDDDNQSVHVGIEVNESKNAQIPIDDVKEECDDDDDDYDDEEEGEYISDYAECEDCVNGICGLEGENDDAHNDAYTEVGMQSGLGKGEIVDEPNASLESDLMIISNVIDASNQSTDNANDLLLINECDQQIRCNQNATRQNSENGQSVLPIVDNQQSIQSTSGIRSSGRNRIQRKLFGDDQSKGEGKGYKRKCVTQSKKAIKKVKHQQVDKTDQGEDDEGKKETKLQVMTLKVNCTEPDCTKNFESFELWKQHLSTIHDQMPYKQLDDNSRNNQHGQAEYCCTKCNAVSKSQKLLYTHWKRYHLEGNFQCSVCEFVANFLYKVRNHYQKKHFSRKIQCTQQGCNQTFKFKKDFVSHQRIHSGEMPYKCTWDNCGASFNQSYSATRHVRMRHFRLPPTVKEQNKLNIIDTRDPNDYIQVS